MNSDTSNPSNQQQQLNSRSSAIYHVPITTEPPPKYTSTLPPPYSKNNPPDYDTLSLSMQPDIQPAIHSSYCQTTGKVSDIVLMVCALRQEHSQQCGVTIKLKTSEAASFSYCY